MSRGTVVSLGALGVGSCLAHPLKQTLGPQFFVKQLVVDGMSFKSHKQISGSPVRHLTLRDNSSLFFHDSCTRRFCPA